MSLMRRKHVKRLLVIAIALPTVLISAVILEGVRGKLALRHWKGAKLLAGESLSAEELLRVAPSPENNAAPELLRLLNVEDLREFEGAMPPAQRYVSMTHVANLSLAKSWVVHNGETQTWTNLQVVWGKHSNMINAATAVLLSQPAFHTPFDFSQGYFDFAIPGLAELKNLGVALEASTLLALHEERPEDAVRHLRALVTIVHFEVEQPFVINHLVGYALAQLGSRATWQAITSARLSPEQLETLAEDWGRINFLRGLEKAFRVERALNLTHWELMQRDPNKIEVLLNGLRESSEILGTPMPPQPDVFWMRYLYLPVWKIAWFNHDQLKVMQGWDLSIDVAQRAWHEGWSGADELSVVGLLNVYAAPEHLNLYGRVRFLFSVHSPTVMSPTVKKAAQAETIAALTRAALLLEAHNLREGRYPNTLKDAGMPPLTDYMDGQPLRYRVQGDQFTLWSVGDDLMDDQGEPILSEKAERKLSIWSGRDAVWPLSTSVVNIPAIP